MIRNKYRHFVQHIHYNCFHIHKRLPGGNDKRLFLICRLTTNRTKLLFFRQKGSSLYNPLKVFIYFHDSWLPKVLPLLVASTRNHWPSTKICAIT